VPSRDTQRQGTRFLEVQGHLIPDLAFGGGPLRQSSSTIHREALVFGRWKHSEVVTQLGKDETSSFTLDIIPIPHDYLLLAASMDVVAVPWPPALASVVTASAQP
jgi:hypothetical protein